MAFLLRLRTIHTVTNPSRSLSLLHHHRHLSSTSNSGAGDLLRLRTFLTLTTPSQLHRHRTSNSVAGDHPNTNHSFLFCLRNIQTFLLHHLRRHLSTSNSGAGDHPTSNNPTPSPSSLRELREAIERLSATDYIVASKTPTYTIFSFDPSSNSNAVPDSSSAADFVPTGKLDEKLHQLKLSALNLGQRQATDRNRLWKLKESRIELRNEVLKNVTKSISRVQEHKGGKGSARWPEICEMMVKEIDGLIAEMKRLGETTRQDMNLLGVLVKSRLASIDEMVKNLSEIREDLQEEVWKELNEGLERCEQVELKEATLLALEMKQQIESLYHRTMNLYEIRQTFG